MNRSRLLGFAFLAVVVALSTSASGRTALDLTADDAGITVLQDTQYTDPGDEIVPPEVSEAELFQGIPPEDILPPGEIAPDSLDDVIPQPSYYLEANGSPARERCKRGCDRQYYDTLVPQCRRARLSRLRAICYATASARYGMCLAGC